MDRSRPWLDRALIERELTSWTQRYTAGVPSLAIADVAEELRSFAAKYDLDQDGIQGFCFLMLQNVIQGREAKKYADPIEQVHGLAPRTKRRYKLQAREGRHGGDAIGAVFERWRYDVALAAQVRDGKTPAAARRFLERHGIHARSDRTAEG